MTDPRFYRLPPPSTSEQFEWLCLDLWRIEWKDPNIQLVGRPGQAQDGIDVISDSAWGDNKYRAIQCKNYKPASLLSKDIEHIAEQVVSSCTYPLVELVIATTVPRDAKLQQKAAEITQAHREQGLFEVHVCAWEDIMDLLSQHKELLPRYWPDTYTTNTHQESNLVELPPSQVQVVGLVSQIDGDVLIETANNLAQQRRFDEALQVIDAFESKQPTMDNNTRFRVLTSRGVIQSRLGKHRAAAENLVAAYSLNKQSDKAKLNAAQAYLSLGDLPSARQIAYEVIQSNPLDSLAWRVTLLAADPAIAIDEVLKPVPPSLQGTSDVLSAFGLLAEQRGDWHAAASYLRESLAVPNTFDPVAGGELAAILLQGMTGAARDDPALSPNPAVSAEGDEVDSLLSRAIAHPGDAPVPVVAGWYLSRCLLRLWRTDLTGAAEDAAASLALSPGNAVATKLTAAVQVEKGNDAAALTTLMSISDFSGVPEALQMKAALQEHAEQLEPALISLNQFLDMSGVPDVLRAVAQQQKLRVLRKSGRPDEAAESVERLLESDSQNPIWLVEKVRCIDGLATSGNQVLQLLTQAAALAADAKLPGIMRDTVAAELFGRSMFNESAHIDEIGACADFYGPRTQRLLASYLNMDKFEKAKLLCDRLREAGVTATTLLTSRAKIYLYAGDLETAEHDLEKCHEVDPEEPTCVLLLAEIELRLSRIEEAKATLKLLHNPGLLNELGTQRLIRVQIALEQYADALAVAYANLVEHYDTSAEAFLTFLSCFMAVSQLAPTEVDWQGGAGKSAVVGAATQTGNIVWYALTPEKTDCLGDAIWADPAKWRGRALLGHTPGDVIDLNPDTEEQPKPVTIREVLSKYAYACRNVFQRFPNAFPQRQELRSIPVADGADPVTISPELEQQIQQMGEHTRRALKLMAMHDQGRLPLPFVCTWLSRNIVETWFDMMESPGFCLRANSPGTPPRTVTLGETTIVLEPVSAVTLSESPLLSGIVPIGGSAIAYAQSMLDTLHDAELGLKYNVRNGLQVMVSDGRHLGIRQTGSEVIEKRLERVRGIIGWIEKNASRQPHLKILAYGQQQYQEISSAIGQAAVDALFLASEEKHILLSDDLALRRLAASLNVAAISTQELLASMLSQGIISHEAYSTELMRLYHMQMRGLYVDASVFEDMCSSVGWDVTHVPVDAFGVLSNRNLGNAGPTVAAGFIRAIFMNIQDPRVRSISWWPQVFKALADGRNPQRAFKEALTSVSSAMPFVLLLHKELADFAGSWLQIRGL